MSRHLHPLVALVAALVLALATASVAAAQAPPADPALCLAGMADYARQNPDWEQHLTPTARRIVQVQRAIGTRGTVVGLGDGPGGTYAVWIAYTDGTDLIGAGVLPPTLEGRPLTVTYVAGPAIPAGAGLESIPRLPTPAGCPGPKAAPSTGPTRLPATGSLPPAAVAAAGASLLAIGRSLRHRSERA